MRVGVDFDRVLFDTEEFKEYLEDEIPGFLDKYGLATGEGYDPETHAEIMGIPPERIHETLDYREDRFLYDDIEDLEVMANHHDVVIISRGDPEFQSTKIENTSLEFEYFIITGKSQDHPKQIGPRTQHPEEDPIEFLVDDREYEHKHFQGPGFHMKRPEDNLLDVIEEDSGDLLNRQPTS